MLLDFDSLEKLLPKLREQYQGASPFPHIVLDDFFPTDVEAAAEAEFPPFDPSVWLSYTHVNERKFANRDPKTWGETLKLILADLQSPRFVEFLRNLTGIKDLIIDESLEGGGLHQTARGGFLNIHADFTVHPKHRDWSRRVNLLLYLNGEWPEEYGGALELWSKNMKHREQVIAPLGNRVLIFNTDADAFHGHPHPLTSPLTDARRSLALYYFTVEDAPTIRSTEYRARPDDGARGVLIWLDKIVVRVYDRTKRRLHLSDEVGSKILKVADRVMHPRGK